MRISKKMSIRSKILMVVLSASIGVFVAVGGYLQYRIYSLAKNDAQKIALSYAHRSAQEVQTELEFDMGFTRAFANSLEGFQRYNAVAGDSIYVDMSRRLLQNNPRYVSVWYNLEYSAIQQDYGKSYGRRAIAAHLQNGFVEVMVEDKNMDGDVETSDYYVSKTTNTELLSNPYFFSFAGEQEVLLTSLGVPIRNSGRFVGLAGVDIVLEKFQGKMEGLSPYPRTRAFLLSGNGTIVADTNPLLVGKTFQEVYPHLEMQQGVTRRMARGQFFNFDWKENQDRYLYAVAPFRVGNAVDYWAVGLAIPYSEILVEAKGSTAMGVLVVLLGVILLGTVLFLMAQSISKPIQKTTQVLNAMAQGDTDDSMKLSVSGSIELAQMATSVNKLIDGLTHATNFANEIGKGNLDAQHEPQSENDRLGLSLIAMQKSLKEAGAKELDRQHEEQKLSWSTQGMALFGEILRQHTESINDLSYNILKGLVDYTQSNQGGLFLVNDAHKENPVLEMAACYAFNRRKQLDRVLEVGEGLVGRCFQEAQTILMTEVPENYIAITSGLGESRPRCLILVPLKYNEEIFGVIEMASFTVYAPHEVEFIENLAQSIAATISSTKINIRTAQLLTISHQQAEEMQAQEEEMRQNMEELQATQEEMERKQLEQEQVRRKLQQEIEGLKKRISSADHRAIALAIETSTFVIEYNTDGFITRVNEAFTMALGVQPVQMLGKNHRDIFLIKSDDEVSYAQFWDNLRRGILQHRQFKGAIGTVRIILNEIYSPVQDEQGRVVKIIAIAVKG